MSFTGSNDFEDVTNAPKSHPFVLFFHGFFRGISLLVYLMSGWFTDSFSGTFVCVVLLLSADFWTVKNITGRLLVGLRWWSYVDEEGKSHWVFETKENAARHPVESRLFWLLLIAFPALWTLLMIAALFTFDFKWMLLIWIALTLNAANLYGYIKCYFGAKKDIKTATTDFVRSRIFKNAVEVITQTPA